MRYAEVLLVGNLKRFQKRLLESEGSDCFRFDLVENSLNAAEYLKYIPKPALIILNVDGPEIDEIVFRNLQSLGNETSKIPLILFSDRKGVSSLALRLEAEYTIGNETPIELVIAILRGTVPI